MAVQQAWRPVCRGAECLTTHSSGRRSTACVLTNVAAPAPLNSGVSHLKCVSQYCWLQLLRSPCGLAKVPALKQPQARHLHQTWATSCTFNPAQHDLAGFSTPKSAVKSQRSAPVVRPPTIDWSLACQAQVAATSGAAASHPCSATTDATPDPAGSG